MAYDADPVDEEPVADTSGDDVHADALAEFDAIAMAQQEERAIALEDRRFVSIAGAQWEGAWGEQFENSIMVEVNKTAMGIERIFADYRRNRITANFRSVGNDASEETAETLNGMFRADAYNSKAQQALDNAFEEAVQGGWGAFRLVNRYEDPNDPDNDAQRLYTEIIVDADQSVFFDMDARLYDKSDARFCFVISAMSHASFKRQFGDDKLTTWPDGIMKLHYDWYTPEVVRVAEYYCVEERKETRLSFQNRATGEKRNEWKKDLDDGEQEDLEVQGWRLLSERRVTRRRVAKYVMSGQEILRKKTYVAGDQIPVIPVYGKRWFIDNMERVRGHVRLAKDPQRIYNAQISKLTETAALAPMERPIFTPEQVSGHETSWAEANIKRAPYALINPIIGADGNPMPAAQLGMIAPPQLSPVLGTLIQVTASDIAELTNADDGADEVKSNISAEAMDLAATRTDAKAFVYTDNFRQSVQRWGEIWLGMTREVYVEEGREVETMDEEGGHGTATLYDPQTDERGRFSIANDIAKGQYKVISDVTEATATRRDKTVKTLTNAAQIVSGYDPELAGAMTNVAIMNMDGEGISDLQEWIRGRMVRQGVVKPNDEEKAQMQEEQANAQPDAQTKALDAVAEKESALAGKAVADTELSSAKVGLTKAQTLQTLAAAGKTGADTDQTKLNTERTQQTPIEQPQAVGEPAKKPSMWDRMRGK